MEIEAGIFEIAFDRDERIDVIAEREAGGRAGLEIEIAVEGDGVPPEVSLPLRLMLSGTTTPASTPT